MFVPDWPAMPRLMFCQGVWGTFLRHYQGMLLALPTNMRLCYNTCKFNPSLVLRYEVLGLRLVAPKLQKLYQTLMTTIHGRGLCILAKFIGVNICDSDKLCTCIDYLERHDTDRIISISVASPKVTKASTVVIVPCCFCWCSCLNVSAKVHQGATTQNNELKGTTQRLYRCLWTNGLAVFLEHHWRRKKSFITSTLGGVAGR